MATKQKEKKDPSELDGMPDRTELGKKAQEYLELKDQLDADRKKKLGKIGDEVLALLKSTSEKSIKIGQRTLSVKHIDKEELVVQRSKT